MTPPTKAQIVVIGGGPAGSYAAAALQREGHEVVVLESAKFPRYHVGESLLPSMRNYLEFIDAAEDFANYGFVVKPGGAFQIAHGATHTWTDFASAHGPDYLTWNVIRAEMDKLLLDHAAKQGVKVFEETRVESLKFTGDPATTRPISANWVNKAGKQGSISFDWLVDASGRAGVMSTKYLKNRHIRESLRNIAVWGYWKDAKRFGEGTVQANSGWFEALTDETGWAWAIPLHDGTTSIGFIMHQKYSTQKKAAKPNLLDHYLDQLQFAPGVRKLIREQGSMVDGNFVDPFFSSGVHIALTGGLAAAVTICASIKGEASEELAQKWHDSKVGIAHTRFLFVVLGAYQQMQLQQHPILSDVNEENFDEAFRIYLRHCRQLDRIERREDLQLEDDAIDRFQTIFNPNISESHIKTVRSRYGADLVNMTSAVLGAERISELAKDDEEMHQVLTRSDALKVLGDELEATTMGRTPLHGYTANVVRGSLGLKRVAETARMNGHTNGAVDQEV
uniref:Halogenase n=1 Tax=Mycena chlorophos TaxID=658473 RepID=A0ABQ0LE03_MYCCL|nr:halogenase [Mycena chlorophos]